MANFKEHSEEELVRLGREALRANRFDRAREAFAEYTARLVAQGRQVPAGILANEALAVGHGNLKEGIALCQAALKSDRRVPEVYYCLAQLYLLSKARRQAWDTLRQGLSRGPEAPGAPGAREADGRARQFAAAVSGSQQSLERPHRQGAAPPQEVVPASRRCGVAEAGSLRPTAP